MYVQIGYCLKPHGLKGDLKIHIEEAFWDDFEELDTVFIGLAERPLPYFVEDMKGGFPDVIVKLEEINTPEDAKRLATQAVYAREEDLLAAEEDEEDEDEISLSDLMLSAGYTVIDATVGKVGEIVEVVTYPHQYIAYVNYKDREVMIPLTASFIIQMDKTNKLLQMDLPEGLLDL